MFEMTFRLTRVVLMLIGALAAISLSASDGQATEPGQPPVQAAAPQPTNGGLFPLELAQRVARLASDVESAGKAIERVKNRDSGLGDQRSELERLEAEAQGLIEELQPRLRTVGAQLQQLGPAPAKDAAPEAEAIALERTRLTSAYAEIEGAIKTTELSLVRSRQLIQSIQSLRQALFKRDLLRFSGSPLSLSTWGALQEHLGRSARQISRIAGEWWRILATNWLDVVLVISGALLINVAAGRWIVPALRRRLQPNVRGTADLFPQAGDASWEVAARAVPPVSAAAFLYAGLDARGLMTPIASQFVMSVLQSIVLFATASALAHGALASASSGSPRVDVAETSAPKLLRWVKAFAVLSAFDMLTGDVVRMLYLPVEIDVTRVALTSFLFAGLLVWLIRIPISRRASALVEPPPTWHPRWLKLPIAAAAMAIAATTLTGYVALGRFISGEITLVGAVALVLYTAHIVIRRLAVVLTGSERPIGNALRTRLGLDPERMSYVTRMLVVGLELLLALAVLPLVLLTWGYSTDDIIDWLKLGIVGFEVGQYRISLVRILLALLLFLLLVFATRVIQRWLDRSVLSPARVDRSISHSVLTGVGYAGVAVALVVGLSYAGLDFTQLAIVAGALSVGIGFGLQAIFNNFVSGIILLVERPIKVGDWIVVNGQEGIVRRINVRATEIETFDRSSIIVPNSVLITGSVTNWTHRNPVGRLVIRVGVSYKADPELVLDILKRVADQSPSLLREPAPSAVFENFGDSALMFSLRAFVPDVTRRLSIESDLRIAIARAFRDAGIEIPYPQHDIHLRDLDGIKLAFARALEARRREQTAAEENAPTGENGTGFVRPAE